MAPRPADGAEDHNGANIQKPNRKNCKAGYCLRNHGWEQEPFGPKNRCEHQSCPEINRPLDRRNEFSNDRCNIGDGGHEKREGYAAP